MLGAKQADRGVAQARSLSSVAALPHREKLQLRGVLGHDTRRHRRSIVCNTFVDGSDITFQKHWGLRAFLVRAQCGDVAVVCVPLLPRHAGLVRHRHSPRARRLYSARGPLPRRPGPAAPSLLPLQRPHQHRVCGHPARKGRRAGQRDDRPGDQQASLPVEPPGGHVRLHLHPRDIPLAVAPLHDLLVPRGRDGGLHRPGGGRLDTGAVPALLGPPPGAAAAAGGGPRRALRRPRDDGPCKPSPHRRWRGRGHHALPLPPGLHYRGAGRGGPGPPALAAAGGALLLDGEERGRVPLRPEALHPHRHAAEGAGEGLPPPPPHAARARARRARLPLPRGHAAPEPRGPRRVWRGDGAVARRAAPRAASALELGGRLLLGRALDQRPGGDG
mmetsp:Transcript_129803/g.403724  ORF Transcript_129803/g.403724 Transcript_129803/m.403724 type:complete len:388 (-) Transcript_129803:493-1656(-)